jgi:iron complex transport system ATP-binding protein
VTPGGPVVEGTVVEGPVEGRPRSEVAGGPPVPGPMITFERVTVRFGATEALRGVSGTIGRGEWVGLIGANGAGKTTLLRSLAHLERHQGLVRVDGQSVDELARRRRAQLVAYVPQTPELPADMTVIDYTLLGRTPHHGYFGLDTEEDRLQCGRLLEQLDLGAEAGRTLSTLSGGEVQRVVLARALAQDAPVLLLDEATSALDLGRRVEALELVDHLRRQRGLTVISALHDLTLAGQFADRLMLMAGGEIVASGPPAQVLREDMLSAHYGTRVRVMVTEDGEAVVVPRRTVSPRPGDRRMIRNRQEGDDDD